MLQNYLKITFRMLWQNRLYSAINVVGLAVGITCVLLAILYIKDERSFDRFHGNAPNLYRITTTMVRTKGGQAETTGGTGQVQGPVFKAQVPEVQNYVRIMGGDIFGNLIAAEKSFNLQLLYVDSTFFKVFTFKFLSGNPETALQGANTVVITERTARKFFNSIDVVGKTLLEDGPSGNQMGASIITGVVQDPPRTSSLQFDVLFPFKFMQVSFDDTSWLNAYLGTFVVLHPKADPNAVVRKFDKIHTLFARQQRAENRKNYGFDPAIRYGLQRMTDIHLAPLYESGSNREGGVINGSKPVFSYLFLGISAFILLMASINFVNISIANSLKRAKEVGIRKITGSRPSQIIFQFLGESALLCLLAFGLALILLFVTLPVFNQLSGKGIMYGEIMDKNLLTPCLILLIVNILMTGFYPALVLSKFKPTHVLYNRQKLSGRNWLGRSLVVVQFSLSVFLVVCTLVFYHQMRYVRTKDLGYSPDQVIYTTIPGARDFKAIQAILRNELANQPGIQHVSFGSELGGRFETRVADRMIHSVYRYIDEFYLPALSIPLKAGRNLSLSFLSDKTNAVIVNEAFIKAAGLSKPIGKTIRLSNDAGGKTLSIVGVVQNFHFGSLKERIQPLAMFMKEDQSGGIWVKIDKNRQQGLAAFEEVYKKTLPMVEYHYRFLDEINAKDYQLEQQWQRIVGYAATLAILICTLGLFGLAHLSAQQRTKEIGIRKVLGATVASIVVLLSKDFIRLVLIAILIASPVAAGVMNRWLQAFAYRIDLAWWVFALAGGLAIVIALATLSVQAIKAALMDPVVSLRRE
ncbi:ABC transporter permease [Larkinella knui]|uniref:ABC transporter permease n=1 Tax=Larkinella knui TaxID=2025310 RepID=A0A3P1CQ14_9BACT|nr:ABC transporter permease [Larkinella knui]RRB15339.1 ABC transporter permease [Larkinella knui]